MAESMKPEVGGGERDVRVMLFSHAYSRGGPRRQLDALARLVELKLVGTPVWEAYQWPVTDSGSSTYLKEVARLGLFGHQHLLASLTLGMRSFRPDVIHVDYEPWSIIFWQVRLTAFLFARKARFVAGGKKNTYRRYGGIVGWLKRGMGRLGLRWSDRVEAASEMSSRMYQREFDFPPERIDVITHMGVDTDLFRPASREVGDEVVVGYCGQLSEHKGTRLLVDAIGRLQEEDLNINLDLIGSGPLEGELAALAAKEPWLTVRPPVPNDEVAEFLQGLDIYALPALILPDHQEHDAHALLQALSCGVASIGSRSGIIPEILAEGVGVLIEPGNEEELIAAVAALAADARLRAELSERGRTEAVDKYSLDRVAGRKAEHYYRMLDPGTQ